MFDKPLKFFHSEDSKIFFTSDLHLNHDKPFVWEKRGFKSVKEHNDAVLASINDVTTENDILINLGDFCLNSSKEDYFYFRDTIKPRHYYIFGNHNSRIKHDFHNWESKIKFLGHYVETVINNQNIVLCHYPIAVWNGAQKGVWHLCGHTHHEYHDSLPTTKDRGRILDVGWDGYKKILTFDDVKSIMDGKVHFRRDGHH